MKRNFKILGVKVGLGTLLAAGVAWYFLGRRSTGGTTALTPALTANAGTSRVNVTLPAQPPIPATPRTGTKRAPIGAPQYPIFNRTTAQA
jgi:hypothetical protein